MEFLSCVLIHCMNRYQLHILDLCLWAHCKHSALLLRPRNEKGGGSLESGNSLLDPRVFSRRQIDDVVCAVHQNTDDVVSRLSYGNRRDSTVVEAALEKLSAGEDFADKRLLMSYMFANAVCKFINFS